MASISRIVSAETACVRLNSKAASRRFSKSCSVPLTVFFMSRNELSMRSAASTDLYPSIMNAGDTVA